MSPSAALGRAARPFGRWGALVVLVALAAPAAGDEPGGKEAKRPSFEELLARHQGLTYEGLRAKLSLRESVGELSFDPERIKHYDRVRDKLQLTDAERALYRKNEFVVVEQHPELSFASAYYQIYTQDLPVLVTCDSILHAMHRSYDQLIIDLELNLFADTLDELLRDCHTLLARKAARNQYAALAPCYRDVDLYLTVARSLLAGAGAPAQADPPARFSMDLEKDEWKGLPPISSALNQNRKVLERLWDIQSLVLQLPPPRGQPTAIYGGARFVDYSQFRPRGHYLERTALRRYFRCLMWLSRPDCGWNVLPVPPGDGVICDSDRELRDAVLLVELLRETDNLTRLRAMDNTLAFLVGTSDNLTVFGLLDLLKEQGARNLDDLADGEKLTALKTALEKSAAARQAIRSQVLISDETSLRKVPPPALFQLFGQRYTLDSFVLSQVVFDAIIYNGQKQRRMMPQGLDVMAALGNDAAVPLLKEELEHWHYSGNLQACRDLVTGQEPAFWKANLYNVWLDCLRSLAELPTGKHFPEALRTHAWRLKQLQAQHASWAELRHDTILYAKQSFTSYPMCEYPAGYVEPYPHFYAGVGYFAQEARRRLEGVPYTSRNPQRQQLLTALKQNHAHFLRRMAQVLTQLEALAHKELEAAPFTAAETAFLKKLIDRRGRGSGAPQYDGWYCDLYYYRNQASEWKPTVVDVHTDPDSEAVLEAGVGSVDVCVVAVDNENDRMAYAGPVFTYYEFRQPAAQRLTDPEWQQRIVKKQLPARPAWVETFHGPVRRR
jgi:hypothetical protein